MRTDLLDLLVCPACLPGERPLTLSAAHQLDDDAPPGGVPDVWRGRLHCAACDAVYAIEEGVALLAPGGTAPPAAQAKYDAALTLGAYLWSSFGDLMAEPDASDAYAQWAALCARSDAKAGPALDVGCAVGRSTLEFAATRGFAVGLDLSRPFIAAARRLLREGRLSCRIKAQGQLLRAFEVTLPARLQGAAAEFIVADAMALPFRTEAFTYAASLNVVDKLPDPMAHVRDLDRVLANERGELLLADPFSWSEEIAPPERWLGGVAEGPLAGLSEDVTPRLLAGLVDASSLGGGVRAPFVVAERVPVSWKIRNHKNHMELIVSQTLRAVR